MNHAQTVFHGGDILTMDPQRPLARAMAVADGRILAVGDSADMAPFRNDRTQDVNLGGRTLMPGLIEPHSHPLISALLYDWVDLSAFHHQAAADVMNTLKKAIDQARPGVWICAFGYDPILLRDLKALNADQLDRLAPHNPLFIMIQSMHTMFVNHMAFQRAGVSDQTPQPRLGTYEKDDRGRLTGVIIEQGAGLPFLVSILSEFQYDGAALLKAQMERYARAGYTCVGVMGDFPVFPDAFGLLRRVAEADDSPVRVFVMDKATDLESGLASVNGPESARFKNLGVKFWYDGSPYTGNMWLDDPFLNGELMQKGLGVPPDTRGYPMIPKDVLAGLILKYHRQGRQIAIHAQGDRAIREVIDVFESALQAFPRPDHRHRIEHGALFPLDQLQRAKDLGLTISWHINHIHYYGEALRDDILGPDRVDRLMPMNDARKKGLIGSLHNDSPMYPAEPLKLLRTAVTRKTRNNALIGPGQAVSVEEGLKALTINAAWQLFMDDQLGSLEPGKRADLVVLSDNPLKVNPDRLDQIQVLETWSGGKRYTFPETK